MSQQQRKNKVPKVDHTKAQRRRFRGWTKRNFPVTTSWKAAK